MGRFAGRVPRGLRWGRGRGGCEEEEEGADRGRPYAGGVLGTGLDVKVEAIVDQMARTSGFSWLQTRA